MSLSETVVSNTLITMIARFAMLFAVPVTLVIAGFVWGAFETNNEQDRELALIKLQIQSMGEVKSKLEVLDDRTITILQSIARIEATLPK